MISARASTTQARLSSTAVEDAVQTSISTVVINALAATMGARVLSMLHYLDNIITS